MQFWRISVSPSPVQAGKEGARESAWTISRVDRVASGCNQHLSLTQVTAIGRVNGRYA
jgi:hypothetical protein